MVNDNTPILIGAGLTVQKEKDIDKVKSPLALLTQAGEAALADAGGTAKQNIDTVAGIRFVTDSPEGRDLPIGRYNNIGLSVARELGLAPSQALVAARRFWSAARGSARLCECWGRAQISRISPVDG